jgi:hypothetical protein
MFLHQSNTSDYAGGFEGFREKQIKKKDFKKQIYFKTGCVYNIYIKSGPVPHWYDKGTSVSFAQGHKNPNTSLPCPTQ